VKCWNCTPWAWPGGYTQADVTALAQVLTGWRLPLREWAEGGGSSAEGRFDAAWHQPGAKTVLGKSYAAGPDALDQVLHDLARHPPRRASLPPSWPATSSPTIHRPPWWHAWRPTSERTGGDLPSLYRTLVQSPEAWAPQPAKLKSPEEFASAARACCRWATRAFARQPDLASARWANVFRPRPRPPAGPTAPKSGWARTRCGSASNGPPAWPPCGAGRWTPVHWPRPAWARCLQAHTLQQIERAADGPQALALLLLAPEFQRR
jgi:uncharacterized protein (DUF1800 family)